MKLLILADDFTGAMDTGCQFARNKIPTWILTSPRTQELPDSQVLVVNTQTRHADPSEAYRIVQETLRGLKDTFDSIYIKTDSAFRGNISASLAAAVDTVGVPLRFVPSYPQVGRTLLAGRIYIGEDLLEHSVFSRDPRTPMRISKASDIIRMDYPLRVSAVPEPGHLETEDAQVYVYDCTSLNSLSEIAEQLFLRKRLRLIGGCAGLAGILAPHLVPKCSQKMKQRRTGGVLIVSGSANAVTFAQLVKRKDAHMINLAREEVCMDAAAKCLANGETVIIAAACSAEDIVQDAAQSYHLELADKISSYTQELLQRSGIRNLAVFGGDTVQSILERLECRQVEALGDLEEGVPVCAAQTRLGTLHLVTKSGGLGSASVVPGIIQYFTGGI